MCRNRRCFICLGTGHVAKHCNSGYVCKRCKKGKHHISICESGSDWRNIEPKGTGNNDNKDGKHNNDSNGFVGHTGCDGILLQTAIANICLADTTEVKNCTGILFDSGSQRSYISEKVRTRLQLKTIRREKVIIKTFGQTSDSEVQKLDVVQLNIKNKFDNAFTLIEALCVPTICSPLTNQHIAITRELEEFKDLKFAKCISDSTTLSVGILIGIDFYHAFMTGKIIRSKDGPIACGTRLGWVISGRLGSGSPNLHFFETYLLRTAVEEVDLTDILRNDLDKFWAVKNIGSDSDQVVSDFRNNIIHDGTRYVTKLPFN